MSGFKRSVDIIIPTFNGGERLIAAICAIKAQQYDGDVGIILVDSGSSDGSIERYEVEDSVKIYRIEHDQFSHSFARNIGADHSVAENLLFMTQDAVPIDKTFLNKMIAVLEEGYAAVSCSDNTENCPDLFYKVSTFMFQRGEGILGQDRECFYKKGMSIDELKHNCRLNNVACCINREIFLKYRFEGKYGEDFLLAKKLIQDGYKLKILGSVSVDHFHDRSPLYFLKRQYVETKTINAILNDKNNLITAEQGRWLVPQSLWVIEKSFEITEKFWTILSKSKLGTDLFFFIFRQIMKLYEKKDIRRSVENRKIKISDGDLQKIFDDFSVEYEFCPFLRNTIVDIRDFIRLGFVEYIKDNCSQLSFGCIKTCIMKEMARSLGEYLARMESIPSSLIDAEKEI